MAIIYGGLKDLNSIEEQQLKLLVEHEAGKVEREFSNAKLVVEIDKAEKAGARAKYSIHLRLEDPSLLLTAEDADWDLVKAVRVTFGKLLEQAQKNSKKAVASRLKKEGKKNFEKNLG
jgi:ribosome-associated translation inhibitor RaiA